MLDRAPLLVTGLVTGEGTRLEDWEAELALVLDLTTARARRS